MDGYDHNGFDNGSYDSGGFNSNSFRGGESDNGGFDNSGYGNGGFDQGGAADNSYGSGLGDDAYEQGGYNNNVYNISSFPGAGFGNGSQDNYSDEFEQISYQGEDTTSDNSFETPLITQPVRNRQQETSSKRPVGVDENFAEGTESTLQSLNAELTEAEIEDMRRERAARKRKRMLREKRRRERRRQAIIRCSILLAAVILVLVIIVKIFAGIGGLIKNAKHDKKKSATTEAVTTEEATTQEPVAVIDESIVAKDLPATREEALDILKTQAETDSDIKNIVENEAIYPDIVIKHLAINTELIEFALFYPAQISIPFNGDFTIDADTSEIPLFLNYDERWAYADYGTTVLGLDGNAPVCLSMAYVYLTGDGSKNPIIVGDFSMDNGYLKENDVTDFKLMTEGAEELGLQSTELDLNKDNLILALEEGNVVICAVSPGDFTRDRSFIVIKEYRNGFFYVNDPASKARSQVGWDYNRLSSQISAMWSIKAGAAANIGSTDSTTDGTADGVTDGEAGEGAGDGTATDGDSTDGAGDGTATDEGSTDGTGDGTGADGVTQ